MRRSAPNVVVSADVLIPFTEVLDKTWQSAQLLRRLLA